MDFGAALQGTLGSEASWIVRMSEKTCSNEESLTKTNKRNGSRDPQAESLVKNDGSWFWGADTWEKQLKEGHVTGTLGAPVDPGTQECPPEA